MANQDGRHSEMITQLLRHVASQTHDADVKGDIFRHTIYPASLVVIAFTLGNLRSTTTSWTTTTGSEIRVKQPREFRRRPIVDDGKSSSFTSSSNLSEEELFR